MADLSLYETWGGATPLNTPLCPHCSQPMVIGTVLLGSPWICPKRGAHK